MKNRQWVPPQRNFDNIQYESYRRVVDPKFIEMADELSDCYYNFWKHGQSKPFNGGTKTYDVQPTVEESKQLFNELHGLIWNLHEKALEDHHNSVDADKKDAKFSAMIERMTEKRALRLQIINELKVKKIEITR